MLCPEVESLLIFKELDTILLNTHNKRGVLIAFIIIHNLVKLLLQLQTCRVHLEQTLSQFLWLHHLGLAL